MDAYDRWNAADREAPPRHRSGNALRYAAGMLVASLALALATAWLLRDARVPQGHPLPRVNAAVTAAGAQKPPQNTLVYHADRSGHFYVDAVVNGANVRFLVDTGATVVALTPADAHAAGLAGASLRYSERVSTAHGEARAAHASLRELRLGQFSLEDVSALVMEQPMDISLLGMSFLSRLGGYTIRDGVLTMEW
jgi:aspartyl protease family protein